jgi:hypothetical protein
MVSIYSTVQIVATNFLRSRSITLTCGMGGERSPISKYTVLHLIGFEKITDQSFAGCRHLETLLP